MSTFRHGHQCRLACQDLLYGPFNAEFKLDFDYGAVWLLRFSRGGKVHGENADEKVAMEATVINIIHREITMPILRIESWASRQRALSVSALSSP